MEPVFRSLCGVVVMVVMLSCDTPQAPTIDYSALPETRGLYTAGKRETINLVSPSVKNKDEPVLNDTVWRLGGLDGVWSVRENAVHTAGAFNRTLWLNVPLDKGTGALNSVRVQFDAWTDSPNGELRFEIFGDGHHHESGYLLVMGAWGGRANLIARMDEHWDIERSPQLALKNKTASDRHRVISFENTKVEPERRYKMTIIRTDGELRWFVDGKLLLSYPDPTPLKGEAHRYFGLSSWDASLYVEQLTIDFLAGNQGVP